ncbi:SpoIIE family protein phosphatase [Magnetococcales bacterium HHB-1]
MAKTNHILIVDDIKENIDILVGILSTAYRTQIAKNGEKALQFARSTPKPDLILLDIMMPGMDGYEVCRRLKADDHTKDIPIIFVTAKSQIKDELKGLALGAVDYITKPFSPPVIQARIKTHLELCNTRFNLEKRNQTLHRERKLIENILLRMRSCEQFSEQNIRYLIASVEETNGDILLASYTPSGRQLIFVGDFTGHGLTAAIGGPLISFIFYSMAAEDREAREIISKINTVLCDHLPADRFLTAILFEISPTRDRLTYWNAGMPECILIREKEINRHLPSTHLPLGIVEDAPLNTLYRTVRLNAGDTIYAFSDGIAEATAPQGELFGMERVEKHLAEIASKEESPNALVPILKQYVQKDHFDDDITLVEISI